jgi:hypothetical protein
VPEELVFTSYPVFRAVPERLKGIDRDVAAKEVADLLDDHSDRIEVRR